MTFVGAGLVERRPYRPGRDEFHLTAAGRELWPALYALLVPGPGADPARRDDRVSRALRPRHRLLMPVAV